MSLTAYLWPIDRSGEIVKIVELDGRYGFINLDGRIVVEPQWENVRFDQFDELGIIFVMRAGKWGMVNREDEILMPPQWRICREFDKETGLAPVMNSNDKWGYINLKGELAIPTVWDDALGFDVQKLAAVGRDENWGWIDAMGEVVIQPTWHRVGQFDEKGMAEVRSDDLSQIGWINMDGDLVIPMEYQSLFYDSDSPRFDAHGLAAVMENGRHIWINRKGEIVVLPEWDECIANFSDQGLAAVAKYEPFEDLTPEDVKKDPFQPMGEFRWGWINLQGKVVIPLTWEDCSSFDSQGMAQVRRDDRWGWIDTAGEIVIPPGWSSVTGFDQHNMARVGNGLGAVGWIDRKGDLVIPLDWKESTAFDSNGLALAKTIRSTE